MLFSLTWHTFRKCCSLQQVQEEPAPWLGAALAAEADNAQIL
jgi:hypothetical protein